MKLWSHDPRDHVNCRNQANDDTRAPHRLRPTGQMAANNNEMGLADRAYNFVVCDTVGVVFGGWCISNLIDGKAFLFGPPDVEGLESAIVVFIPILVLTIMVFMPIIGLNFIAGHGVWDCFYTGLIVSLSAIICCRADWDIFALLTLMMMIPLMIYRFGQVFGIENVFGKLIHVVCCCFVYVCFGIPLVIFCFIFCLAAFLFMMYVAQIFFLSWACEICYMLGGCRKFCGINRNI